MSGSPPMISLPTISPQATIGISFKNPGPMFRIAVQSVFAQTVSDWELILMDDMSDDGSFEFASSIADPRVRTLRDGKTKSLSIRLNELSQLASAPYYFRMDADDIMHPERLEKQLRELRSRPPNTIVGTRAYSIDKDSNVVGIKPNSTGHLIDFAARHYFVHPSVAASTEWFLKNPYANLHRSEDAELWCRTSRTSNFLNMSEPLLFYREVGTFNFFKHIGTWAAVMEVLQRYREPRGKYLLTFTREVLKFWVTGMCEATGNSDILTKRRSKPLSRGEALLAAKAIAQVYATELPLTGEGAKALEVPILSSSTLR